MRPTVAGVARCLALVAVPLPEASGDAREAGYRSGTLELRVGDLARPLTLCCLQAHHRPQMRREPLQHRCSEAERCETHDPGPMSSCDILRLRATDGGTE